MFKEIIKMTLRQDIGKGDITTEILIPKDKKVNAVIIAKQKAVVCGITAVEKTFKSIDKNIKFKSHFKDGNLVDMNSEVASVKGRADSILKAERTALNFLSHLSGIATQTRRFVDLVKPYKVEIFDTRKTLPGLRLLEKYAVRCGGGYNHRHSLYDMVLIKDNHLSILRDLGIRDLVKMSRRKISYRKKIEIEVKDFRQYCDAAIANPDIIMLDNMTVDEVRKIVKFRKEYKLHHLLEVSGNINFDNIRAYARTGVERISIGALTHSANSIDFTLKII
jgi:nicotinate-nucleotide pyrophosphorylase (carboxylating)